MLDTKFEKALVSDVTLRVLEAFGARGIQAPAILHRNAADKDSRIEPQAIGIADQRN